MNPVWSILIPAASGLLAGIAGSLIAPWVHWGIEKRREKLRYRREIVEVARQRIEAPDFSKQSFRVSREYRYLRPYLDENIATTLERDLSTLVGQSGEDPSSPYRKKLIEALAKLERKWGLV